MKLGVGGRGYVSAFGWWGSVDVEEHSLRLKCAVR